MMHMKQTVFKRFLFFSLIVAIICVTVAFSLLTLPITNYIENSKAETLTHNNENIAKYVGEVAGDNLASIENDRHTTFDSSMDTLSDSLHLAIVITDTNGKILWSSVNTPELNAGYLPETAMAHLADGSYFEHGTLENIYDHNYYVSAVDITADNNGCDVIGYCIVAQETLWTSDFIPSVFTMLTLLIVLAAFLVFLLTSVYAYNTTRPLKQMSAAAKRFAVGDFESRVYVKTKDEIGELAAAFNEMADSLASSEGMRRNFIANVSHELKTPMTTISGYIDGILDGTIPQREQSQYLKIVAQEIRRLSRLVSSMISLSKIDSGDLSVNKQNFVIQDTVFSVLLGLESRISAKKLNIFGLENDEDTVIFGDKDLIYQVVYNLVENAVKFTPEGGDIRFGFSSKGGNTYVYIENSGAGILTEDLRHVFDKFYKGDKSRSADKNSMGLGLYIVRTIVLLHAGNITVESEPGEFCRFIFWLPDAPRKRRELPDNIKEEN